VITQNRDLPSIYPRNQVKHTRGVKQGKEIFFHSLIMGAFDRDDAAIERHSFKCQPPAREPDQSTLRCVEESSRLVRPRSPTNPAPQFVEESANGLGQDGPIKHSYCGRKPQITTVPVNNTTFKIEMGAAFLPMQRPHTKKLRGPSAKSLCPCTSTMSIA